MFPKLFTVHRSCSIRMVNDVNDERCENGERRSSFKNGVHRLPFIVHIVHGTHHFTCTQYSNLPYKQYKQITQACTVSPVEKLTNRTIGTLPVWSWYGRSTVEVRSWYSRGSVAVRSWYGRGAVRYSLGTLPVRSWYGTLKVRLRLLFSPRCSSNLVHALYVRLFDCCGLAGFSSPGSDRDNKLSLS